MKDGGYSRPGSSSRSSSAACMAYHHVFYPQESHPCRSKVVTVIRVLLDTGMLGANYEYPKIPDKYPVMYCLSRLVVRFLYIIT